MDTGNFIPKLSPDQYAAMSVWEAMKLADLLAAVSTILNAAIRTDGCSATAKYLDNWQALFNDATFDIAEAVKAMRPTSEKDQNARNWLLAKLTVACAEGLIAVAGPGVPPGWDDPFTAGLLAARARDIGGV